jgi:hypothetical protein
MESELNLINLISKKKIYAILRADRKYHEDEIRKNKYRMPSNISRQDLFNFGGSDSYKFICMDTAEGDLIKYKEYYFNWSFREVYELYTLRLVCNYQEPLRKING